ncbi:MAG: EscU/YscU/HrcU family type III secretion system export apparatus switch protein [Spirochaetes bacterium]|nr:EscU/YscU/HrcU family type III secretion system export apparatus switch protein [Spirochaetota bacterium]
MKDKKAVALQYNEVTDHAPRVMLKGKSELADIIMSIAKKNNIVQYQDRDLVEALYALPEGEEISPDLYRAVAEVIAYCYRIKGVE